MNRIRSFSMALIIFFVIPGIARSWTSFRLPAVIGGGSGGYFYLALDEMDNLYRSHWDKIYSVHTNIRIYRQLYASVQYGKYRNENVKVKGYFNKKAFWDEQFINVGIRRYSGSLGRWDYYSGLGFTFVAIEELPGASVFNANEDGKTSGSGLYFELGLRYSLFANLGIFGEFEINSAGEGGTPGFVGHNLGGYAFQMGIEVNF